MANKELPTPAEGEIELKSENDTETISDAPLEEIEDTKVDTELPKEEIKPELDGEKEPEAPSLEEEKPTSEFGVKTEEEYIKEVDTLQKRLADKEAFINVMKNRVEGGEVIIKTLTGKLESVLGFFEVKPEEVDQDRYVEIQRSIPQIRSDIVKDQAVVKLRAAAGQLDLNQDEINEVNRSLQRDEYSAETIAKSSDKSILYYLKSVVDEYRQNRKPLMPKSTDDGEAAKLRDLIAEQDKKIEALTQKLTPTPEEKAKTKTKPKPNKPPVATPSGSGGTSANKTSTDSIAGEIRI